MFRFVKAFGMISVLSLSFFSDEAYSRGSPPPPPPPPPVDNSPAGSYKQTCPNRTVNNDNSIAAECRYDGGTRWTRLPGVNQCKGDISNKNGNLYCDRGLPAGSYIESCDNMDFNGSRIDANCRVGNNWPRTSLLIGKCKAGTISNNNGNLTCNISENFTQPLNMIKASSTTIDNLIAQAKTASETQEIKSDVLKKQLDTIMQIKTNIDAENKKIQDNMNTLNNNAKDFTNDADVKPILDQATAVINTTNTKLSSMNTYINNMNTRIEFSKNIEMNLDKSQKELEQINTSAAKIKTNLDESGKIAQSLDTSSDGMQQKLTNITTLQQSSTQEGEQINTRLTNIKNFLKDYQNDVRVPPVLAKGNDVVNLVKKQNDDIQTIKSSISQKLSLLLDKEKKQKEINEIEGILNQNLTLSAQHVKTSEQKSLDIKKNIEMLNFDNAEKTIKALEELNINALRENSKLHIKHAVDIAGTDTDLQKLIVPNETILADMLKNTDNVKSLILKMRQDLEEAKKYQQILKSVKEASLKTQQAFQNMQSNAEQMKKNDLSSQELSVIQNTLKNIKENMVTLKKLYTNVEEGYQATLQASQNRKDQPIQAILDQTKGFLETSKKTSEEINILQDNVIKNLRNAEILQEALIKANEILEVMKNAEKESQKLLAKTKEKSDITGKTSEQIDARIKEVGQNLNHTTAQENILKGNFDTLNKNLQPFKENPKIKPALDEAQKLSSGLSNNKQQINTLHSNLVKAFTDTLSGEQKKAKVIETLKILDNQLEIAKKMKETSEGSIPKIQEQISKKNFNSAEELMTGLLSLNPKSLLADADEVIKKCTEGAGNSADIKSLIEAKKPVVENIKTIIGSVQANIDQAQNNFQDSKKKENDLKNLQIDIEKKMLTLQNDGEKILQKLADGKGLEKNNPHHAQVAFEYANNMFKEFNTLYQDILTLTKDNQDSKLQNYIKSAKEIFDKVQKELPQISGDLSEESNTADQEAESKYFN
jgi:hypothetical protein